MCFWGWCGHNCSCVFYAVVSSFLKEDSKITRRGIWIPSSCPCPTRPSQSHWGSFLGHVLVWAFLSVLGGKNISWQRATPYEDMNPTTEIAFLDVKLRIELMWSCWGNVEREKGCSFRGRRLRRSSWPAQCSYLFHQGTQQITKGNPPKERVFFLALPEKGGCWELRVVKTDQNWPTDRQGHLLSFLDDQNSYTYSFYCAFKETLPIGVRW